MGLVHQPEVHDYWSQSDLHYSPIACQISKKLEEICWYFHLVDNTALPKRREVGFSRLQKVKGIMNLVHKEFSAVLQSSCTYLC